MISWKNYVWNERMHYDGSKNLLVVFLVGPDLRKSLESLMLRLRSPLLKGDVHFLGTAEYLVHRKPELRESCGLWPGRRGDAVKTLAHKDLYKT